MLDDPTQRGPLQFGVQAWQDQRDWIVVAIFQQLIFDEAEVILP